MKVIDKFIIRKYLGAYVFVALILVLVVIIIQITEKNEQIIQHRLTFREIFLYMLDFIPYIANRIVHGDVGSTMFALLGTAATAASAAATLAGKALVSGGSGFGFATSNSGTGGGSGDGGGGGGGRGTALAGQSSGPPRPPSAEAPVSNSGESGGSTSGPGGGSQQPPSPPKPWRENTRPGQPQSFSFTDQVFWWSGYGLGKMWGSGGQK